MQRESCWVTGISIVGGFLFTSQVEIDIFQMLLLKHGMQLWWHRGGSPTQSFRVIHHVVTSRGIRVQGVYPPPKKKKRKKKKVSQVSNILRIERTTTKACGLKFWATLKIIFPQFLLLHLYRVLGVNIFLKTNSTWHHHLDRKAPHFGDATSTNFPPFPQIFRKSQTWSDSFNGLLNKTRPLPSYLTSWLVIGNSPGGGYNIPYHSPQ